MNDPKTTILSSTDAVSQAAAQAPTTSEYCMIGARTPASCTIDATSAAVVPRGPGESATSQWVMRSFTAEATPAMSLSLNIAKTAMTLPLLGISPSAAANARAACGLCATSSMTCGRPG